MIPFIAFSPLNCRYVSTIEYYRYMLRKAVTAQLVVKIDTCYQRKKMHKTLLPTTVTISAKS